MTEHLAQLIHNAVGPAAMAMSARAALWALSTLAVLMAAFVPQPARAAVQVIVGATPIVHGDARSAGDITVVNENLAFSLAVQSAVPYGVPRGALIDLAPVTDGKIGRDRVVFADFIPDHWSAWPNTYQHIDMVERGPQRAIIRTVRDWGKVTITTVYTLRANSDHIEIRTTMRNGGEVALSGLLSGFTLWPNSGFLFAVPGLQGVVEGKADAALTDRVVAYDEDWAIALHASYFDHVGDGSMDMYQLHTLEPGASRSFEGWLQVRPSGDLAPIVGAEIAHRHLAAGDVQGVVHGRDGATIAEPVVVVEKQGKPYAWVLGHAGAYRIALPAGDYTLYATAKNYSESRRTAVQIAAAVSVTRDFDDLENPGHVAFKVSDAAGKALDARIEITHGQKPLVEFLGRSTFFTDLERKGRIDLAIAPGNYVFSVSSGGGFLGRSREIDATVAPAAHAALATPRGAVAVGGAVAPAARAELAVPGDSTAPSSSAPPSDSTAVAGSAAPRGSAASGDSTAMAGSAAPRGSAEPGDSTAMGGSAAPRSAAAPGGVVARTDSAAANDGQTLRVSLTRLFDPTLKGWYSADLHHHSDQAEAVTPPADLARSQLAAGLDLLFVSDHDSTVNHQELQRIADRRGVPFIPAVELSASWGHFNAYPLQLGPPITVDTSVATVDEIFREARRLGAIVIQANHPFIPYGYLTSVAAGVAPGGFNPAFDLLEINDSAPEDDDKVLHTLWVFWNAGHRYYLAAGTDIHDVWQSESGRARTFVHVDGAVSAAAFATNLKAGHGYVTRGPLVFPSIMFGDEIHVKPGEAFALGFDLRSVEGVKRVQLIGGGTVVAAQTLADTPQATHIDFPQSTLHSTWYALIVEDAAGRKAYTDPIWVDAVTYP